MKTATKTTKKTCAAAAVSIVLASLAGAAAAAPVSGQGTWETTLQARDINGDSITDAFYDTTLNITWLRNANINGQMKGDEAQAWAANLVFGAYSDWRLPTMIDTGAPGCDFSNGGNANGVTDCGFNVQTKSGATVYSEMAHLFHETLGNKATYAPGATPGADPQQPGWGLTNTGDFQDLQADFYWSGLDYAPDSSFAWHYNIHYGYQAFYLKSATAEDFSMAVRSGDVAAVQVPEPATLWLAMLGLAGMGVASKRRAAGASVA